MQEGIIGHTRSNHRRDGGPPIHRAPPKNLASLPPIPIQAHIDNCVIFSHMYGKQDALLTSCETMVVLTEPIPGSSAIEAKLTPASTLISLDMVRISQLCASPITHAEWLDIYSKAQLGLKMAVITAVFTSSDWTGSLAQEVDY